MHYRITNSSKYYNKQNTNDKLGEFKSMLELFIRQFKEKIYLATKNKLTWKEWSMFIGFALAFIGYFLSAIFNFEFLASIFLISSIACLYIIYTHSKKLEKEYVEKNLENYKNNRIEKLESLLKDSTYNLHSNEGIQLIIDYCDNRLSEDKSIVSVREIVTGIVGAACTLLINIKNIDEILLVIVIFLISYFILIPTVKILKYTKDIIENPYKPIFLELKNDLSYIKTQLSNKA